MEQSSYLFAGDSYDTPPDAPKSVWYRLLLKNRWYFYVNNFGIFCRTGRCGRRGELTKERQISYSNENLRLVERCGGKVHLRGLDNLRALDGRPVVLIGNHMSLLETALFHSVARGLVDFTFVIKQSLMEVPFFRDIMTSLEAIPIGRANPRDDLKAVFEEGGKLLASGRSIIIFPQSTRSEEFDPEKFNSIGIKLAKRAGVPVLPFALKTDFLGNGRYFRDLGPVRPEREVWFEFGAAREVAGNGQELQQEIIAFIRERLKEWRSRETGRK
ncbi:lysophospholipid acyltransferase family protein [Victivallis vadensis]|uniref:lysophospholipid acyltransferase family protein n=1 Tax=Victivallis vadensis TaxID=172901 RepID=UPI001DC9637B|nr:lysophospholipid acyltransferase family protein [Victivallis vadensis]HJH05007.1 1-acyl-sn-glycerol-3-phosphate acyltransferase [Victivallis vadensis]